MKKAVILGAGAQGAPCASILSKFEVFDEVVLADYDKSLLDSVIAKINSKRVQGVRVDAGNVQELTELFKDANVAINLTNPIFNANIMEACVASKTHYVDTSVGETMDLDLSATDNVLRQLLRKEPIKFHEKFKEKDITCLIGCGSTPGLTNVLVRLLCDKLDTVDFAKVRFARKSAVPENPDAPWVPTWAPTRAFWGFAVKPYAYVEGQFTEYPLFDGYEEYTFHEPIGKVALTYHHHPEQFTIPYYLGDKVKNCDFKFYIDKNIRTLLAHGFGDPETRVQVGDVSVSPREVLMKMVKTTTERFLEENEENVLLPFTLHTGAAIDVAGYKNGQYTRTKLTYAPTFCENPEEKLALLRRFGATNIYVALPAVVGAMLCARGDAETGVISAECLNATKFMEEFEKMLPLKLYETIYSTYNE